MCVFLCVSDFKYLHKYNLTKVSKKHLPDTIQHIPNDPFLGEGIMIHYHCQLERAPTQCNLIARPEMPSQANVCLSALKHYCVSFPQCSFRNCLRKCSGNY